MKICLFTETALPKVGGQEMVVDALARQFVELGHEPVVLVQYPRRPHQPADDRLPYRVVRHRRFVSTHRLIGWYRGVLTSLRRSFPFDVLHCHSVHPCGYLGSLLRADDRPALVLTSHGNDLAATGQRLHKPSVRARSVQAIGAADACVSISRFTSEGFRALDPAARIVDIPNGIDLAPFAVQAGRPAGLDPTIEAGRYVLFLGRLHAYKGVDVLLDAWAQVAPHTDATLVIAGDGHERQPLVARAAAHGLGGRVRFAGAVQGATKTWLLQNALGACVPSRREAFPLVVLECFAAGQPVIGSRIAGIDELVVPGRTGWLVAPEAPTALAGALRELLAQPEAARAQGRAAKALAQDYSWRSIARRHVELYERVGLRSCPWPRRTMTRKAA